MGKNFVPRFPSSQEQNQGWGGPSGQNTKHRALPPGKQWAGFTGRKDRLRYLKQQCRSILQSKDSLDIAVLQRLDEHLAKFTKALDTELVRMTMIQTTRLLAEKNNVFFHTLLNLQLDEIEKQLVKKVEESKVDGSV